MYAPIDPTRYGSYEAYETTRHIDSRAHQYAEGYARPGFWCDTCGDQITTEGVSDGGAIVHPECQTC